jgi:predicted O-methyltransferase YrrM
MTLSNEAIPQRAKVAAEIRELAPNIDKETEEVLVEMYSASQLRGTAGDQPLRNQVKISIAEGAQINQIIRQSETNKSLETGFAYGFSTVWILDALRSKRNSRHVAIDPFEITKYGGVGLHQVKRLSAAPGFEWIADYSIHALSKLIKSEEKFDFIFIDGDHRFEGVLVDFYLSDQLVRPGALMVFDDMWMPSIRTVVNFILTNRQYKIVPQPVQNMLVLKKLADDNRDWRHFESFKISNLERGRVDSALRQIALKLLRTTGTEGMLRRIQSRYQSKSF